MQTLKKYAPSLMTTVVKPRFRAYYFGKECDAQSACAMKARAILLLLEKKKDLPDQNARIKEEIMVLLDHEKLLTIFKCNALAILTIRELLKLMVRCKSSEELIRFVEGIDYEIEKNYSPTLAPCSPYYFSSHDDQTGNINLQALVHKHMGQGMEYLKELRKSNTRSF
jgi:hypothetical protein